MIVFDSIDRIEEKMMYFRLFFMGCGKLKYLAGLDQNVKK